MANAYYWKVWLRPNLLTKDTEDEYFAEVLTQKQTLRNEDLARAILREDFQLPYDTVLALIRQRDRLVRENLLMGYSVLTEVCHFKPRVSGPWYGQGKGFDPSIHKQTLDIVPSDEMCDALHGVNVEVLGLKANMGRIEQVTDTLSGLSNGHITVGEDIRIDGERIRVHGADSSVGIFFISADGQTATPVTRRLTLNDPGRIIARVPELPAGTYTLRIVTQYVQGATLLKSPRVINYTLPLVIGSITDDALF